MARFRSEFALKFVKVLSWMNSKPESVRPRVREGEPEVLCSCKVHVKARQFTKVKNSSVTGALGEAVCASWTSVIIVIPITPVRKGRHTPAKCMGIGCLKGADAWLSFSLDSRTERRGDGADFASVFLNFLT